MYIIAIDTCPPFLMVFQVSTAGNKINISPMLYFLAALLRLPGVSPPRPATLLKEINAAEKTAALTLEAELHQRLICELGKLDPLMDTG